MYALRLCASSPRTPLTLPFRSPTLPHSESVAKVQHIFVLAKFSAKNHTFHNKSTFFHKQTVLSLADTIPIFILKTAYIHTLKQHNTAYIQHLFPTFPANMNKRSSYFLYLCGGISYEQHPVGWASLPMIFIDPSSTQE